MKYSKIFKTSYGVVLALIMTALTGCDVNDANELFGLDAFSSNETSISNGDTSGDEVVAPVLGQTDGGIVVENNAVTISINDDEEAVIYQNQEPEVPEYEEIFDAVSKIYSVETKSPEKITLSFAGDVGFAEGYATINTYRRQPNGIDDCMDEEVLNIMRDTDIMMVNNEFPYSYRGTPTAGKTYTFRADPKDVVLMNEMGVDIVSLANNHAYDYGPDALIDTLATLTEAKIAYVGAGANIEEAKKPAYIKANGHTIGYVSATQIERYGNPDTKEATETSPGVLRTLDPAKTVSSILEAEENSDFVVVYVHWGSESTDLVEQSQRDLAKAYVEAGADLVIGDHSHCLQGIDYVDGVPVFYSLGNYWFNSKTLDTCIVRATLDSECNLESLEFIPCIQTGCKVKIGDGDNYDRILTYMRGISNYADIDENGFVTKSDTNNNIQNGQNTSPAKKPAQTQEQSQEQIPDVALDESTGDGNETE